MTTTCCRRSPWRLRRFAALVLTAAMAIGTSACDDDTTSGGIRGSGDAATEQREVGDYDRIELRGEGRVLLGAGEDGFVEVEIDDNLMDEIETDVVDGRLVIGTRDGVDIDPEVEVVYRLGCPATAAVRLTGAGTIELRGCVDDADLDAELPGAGTLALGEVELDRLRVSLPGAGQVEVAGAAARLDVELSGAGGLDAGALRAEVVSVRTSGAGSATVWAVEELDVSLTGVGSVDYYGDPEVRTSISGVGSVTSLGSR